MLQWQTLGTVKIPSAGPACPRPDCRSTTVQRDGPNRGASHRKTATTEPLQCMRPSKLTRTQTINYSSPYSHLYVTHQKDTPSRSVKSPLSLGTTCQCSSYLSCGNTWIPLPKTPPPARCAVRAPLTSETLDCVYKGCELCLWCKVSADQIKSYINIITMYMSRRWQNPPG